MNKISFSKYLAYLLRHHPEEENLNMDRHGWVEVKELMHLISFEDLKNIVETDNKQRYSFNEDMSKIRANQGHSIDVDVELEEKIPPDVLYHGSATRFLDSILEQGLISKSRLYVHLSKDIETAIKVGQRHGKVVILEINTKAMKEDNILFYLSKNNVWLTKYVDKKYLKVIDKRGCNKIVF